MRSEILAENIQYNCVGTIFRLEYTHIFSQLDFRFLSTDPVAFMYISFDDYA